LDNLAVTFDKGTVMWEGWDIRRGERQVDIDKTLDEKFKVSFKTFLDNEIFKSNRTDDDRLEFEYSLQGNKALKLYLKEREDIIGLEQKFRF
jgi:hypothetical protein